MKKENGSIVRRIQRTLLIPFAFFFLVVVYLLIFQYRPAAVQWMEKQCIANDDLLSPAFESEITNVKNCTNMIILHLNELLDSSRLDETGCPLPDAKTQTQISKCMLDAFTTFSNLDQIQIVWNNGVSFYEDWTVNYYLSSDSEPLLSALREKDITRYGSWIPLSEDLGYLSGEGPVYAKAYVNVENSAHTGFVILKASPLFQQIDQAEEKKTLLLYGPDGTLLKSTRGAQALPKGDQYYTHTINLRNGWTLSSATDLSEDIKTLHWMITAVLMLNFLLLVCVFLITRALISRIVQPIRQLSDHMANTGEELPKPIHLPEAKDETGILVARFNSMAEHNQNLVNMLLDEKKRQEQLKFSLLQAQIKPHFLYNSLDTIYCLSEMGKNKEASRTTKLLSEYYRHVLSHGLDWVLLSEEVRQTENYLEIQSIRFCDVMEYEIQWLNSVEDILIPKLTLQPLVENAIYHGIRPMGRKGHLRITIQQKDEMIELCVMDDGAGMSLETFDEIIHTARSNNSGFGLRSVYERLSLYYQNRFEMRIPTDEEHCKWQGTCLQILLPVLDDEEI